MPVLPPSCFFVSKVSESSLTKIDSCLPDDRVALGIWLAAPAAAIAAGQLQSEPARLLLAAAILFRRLLT